MNKVIACFIGALIMTLLTPVSAEAGVMSTRRFCMANGTTLHEINFENEGTKKALYKLMLDSGSNYTLKERFTLRPGRSISFLVPADHRTRVTITKYRRVVYTKVVQDICL